jgi:hypothetical protein
MTQSTGLKHKVTTNNDLTVSNQSTRTQTHLKREHKQMSTSHNNDLTVSTCLQGHRQPETFKPASTSPGPSQWHNPPVWNTKSQQRMYLTVSNQSGRTQTAPQTFTNRLLNTRQGLLVPTRTSLVSNLSTRTQPQHLPLDVRMNPSGPPLRVKNIPPQIQLRWNNTTTSITGTIVFSTL